MELQIKPITATQAIEFNYEELKNWVTEKAEYYNSLVYDDGSVKDAKSDRATLNKFVKSLKDARTAKKKEILEPFEDFSDKIDELIAIIEEPLQSIDTHVKEYEQAKKDAKLEEIKAMWESIEHPEWLKAAQIWDKTWLNATVSIKKVGEQMAAKVAGIVKQEAWMKELEYSAEALAVFHETADYEKAIEEGKRLFELKNKSEALKQAESKAVEEVKQIMVEAENEPQKQSQDVKKHHLVFECDVTVEEAHKLKAFCDSIGVTLKRIK